MEFDWLLSFGLVLTATLIAIACLFIIAAIGVRPKLSSPLFFSKPSPSTVFVFDGDILVDATPAAKDLLASEAKNQPAASDLFYLLNRLERLFPDLQHRLQNIATQGRFILRSKEGLDFSLVLRAEFIGGLTKIILVDPNEEAAYPEFDGAADLALRAELTALREVTSHSPILIWRETADGDITWANSAYLSALAGNIESGKDFSWPLPALFLNDDQSKNSAVVAYSANGHLHWHEITKIPLGDEWLCYAPPVDKMIKLEGSLAEFKQTFGKIFAQLPIGLAIFDHNRALQMFNPALLDLTNLSPSFLASRPNMSILLDALREQKMLPEPKDYRSWRQQITTMEQAAASGLYEETWTLPSGKTWRVIGRPHPNGAVAFLIEDISSEMTRTRRFRAELEQSQAVLDGLSDAVIVFAQDGAVNLVNQAATDLWGPGLTHLPISRNEPGLISLWRERVAATLFWDGLVDFIGTFTPREPWDGDLRLLDGRALRCMVTPLRHGATMVTFRLMESTMDTLGQMSGQSMPTGRLRA